MFNYILWFYIQIQTSSVFEIRAGTNHPERIYIYILFQDDYIYIIEKLLKNNINHILRFHLLV